jgi:hypothetical protein
MLHLNIKLYIHQLIQVLYHHQYVIHLLKPCMIKRKYIFHQHHINHQQQVDHHQQDYRIDHIHIQVKYFERNIFYFFLLKMVMYHQHVICIIEQQQHQVFHHH